MIISVQFWREKDNAYTGRQYSYFCTAAVRPGDFVRVLVGKYNEKKVARVAEVNIPESRVEDRILAVMKSVVGVVDTKCEQCANFDPIGEGDHICDANPRRMPVSDYTPTEDYFWCQGRHFHSMEGEP